MNVLLLIDRFAEAVSRASGAVASWLTTVLVITVSLDVIFRYLMKTGSVGIQEMEWHLFAMIFLLGAADTLRKDRHVRVDVLYQRLSHRKRAMLDLAGTVFFLIPFSLLVIWTSKDFVLNSIAMRESSPNPGGLPARYVLKMCIPGGFLILLLQGCANAISSFLTAAGWRRPSGGNRDE